ncbi:MAG: proline dehydrogenase family protein, partial [Streptosporangiaceae bacterium]
MFRQTLLAASRSDWLRSVTSSVPLARDVVARFVAGESTDDAVRASRGLRDDGLFASLDHLGEDTHDEGQAEAATKEYLTLLDRLFDAGLTEHVEVSLKLSAVGQALDGDGDKIAYANAARVCEAARAVGTTVTLDMEDHTTVDATLGVLRDLRRDFPDVGAVIQAYLRRSEADCRDLAVAGSRVRLCKGAYAAPGGVGFGSPRAVDRSYVR